MNIKKAVPKEKRKIPVFPYYGYACGCTYTSAFLSTNKKQIFLCGKICLHIFNYFKYEKLFA